MQCPSPTFATRLLFCALLSAACSEVPALPPGPAPDECPGIGVLPDAPNEFELQWGVSNSNAAIGHGQMSATLSRCGEITSLKWPGPSYYDQIDYLAENAPDARTMPRCGALESAGAFAGIAYRTDAGPDFSWLRDADWSHAQRYASDETDVVVTETHNRTLGLTVTASTWILPDTSVLVSHFEVSRAPDSPVHPASLQLLSYTNFAPTMARIPFFQIADWALDFENDYAVLYDDREQAFLHFVPAAAATYPHDFADLDPLLRSPPLDPAARQAEVNRLIDRLDAPGVYLAFGARGGDDGHQAGFDPSDLCAYQSQLAERTIAAFQLSPAFAEVARALYQCSRVITHPGGVLGACRDRGGWTWDAESALTDVRDGTLSGSSLAACQANAALARRVDLSSGHGEATFYVAIGGTRDAALDLLRQARDPDSSVKAQRAAIDTWWQRFLAGARLPRTDDPEVLRFAKRSLMVLRGATDEPSGAIVASVNAQPPYGADWPRDGAFINLALDLAGFHDLVTRHNLFYARVQRKQPGSWSILYDFPPCDLSNPVYPNCIPAGTFEQNYYADPDEVIPALTTSFEIDQAGLGVWTWWDHAQYLADPIERAGELVRAIDEHFLSDTPSPHYEGERPSWLVFPVGLLGPDHPVTASHAQLLHERSIRPVLEHSEPVIAYNSEPLVALALLAREHGDAGEIAAVQDLVRAFIHELPTPGTGLMSESQGRVPVDLDGDGLTPDWWAQNDVPHAWEHSILFTAAMIAFGGAETPQGDPAPPLGERWVTRTP